MSESQITVDSVVRVRPVMATRIAVVLAALLLGLFVMIAVVMTRDNAGATFFLSDRIATALIGVLAAAGVLLLTRPRLVADRDGLHAKAWAGDPRFIPWGLVVDLQFPPAGRFARAVLPGEEYLALYAVQRIDGPRAVAAMAQLRALHAAVRAEATADSGHKLRRGASSTPPPSDSD